MFRVDLMSTSPEYGTLLRMARTTSTPSRSQTVPPTEATMFKRLLKLAKNNDIWIIMMFDRHPSLLGDLRFDLLTKIP